MSEWWPWSENVAAVKAAARAKGYSNPDVRRVRLFKPTEEIPVGDNLQEIINKTLQIYKDSGDYEIVDVHWNDDLLYILVNDLRKDTIDGS